MITPGYKTIVMVFFDEALNPLLKNFVFNGYSTLAHQLEYPLGIAIILFITLLGIAISQGWVALSVSNFLKAVIRVGLIYSFAMNWGNFSQWIVDGLENSALQLGNWLVLSTPIKLPQFAGFGIHGAMQSVLIEITEIGNWIWNTGSWHAIGPCLTAILIWGFGYALILVGIFEFVLAKMMLALLFAIAPLFISFTLFKATYGFFDRWLGLIASYTFLIIFIFAVLAMALSFSQWALGDAYLNHAVNIHLVGFIPEMIVGFIGIGIILKVADLAQNIGSAITTFSNSELVASSVGGFIGGAWSMATQGGSKGLEAGKTTGKGIASVARGAKNVGGSVGGVIANMGSSAIKGIKNSLRNNSHH